MSSYNTQSGGSFVPDSTNKALGHFTLTGKSINGVTSVNYLALSGFITIPIQLINNETYYDVEIYGELIPAVSPNVNYYFALAPLTSSDTPIASVTSPDGGLIKLFYNLVGDTYDVSASFDVLLKEGYDFATETSIGAHVESIMPANVAQSPAYTDVYITAVQKNK